MADPPTKQTNCLSEIFFEEALERARFLDDYLSREGKPIGPLHGLPISIKVSCPSEAAFSQGNLSTLRFTWLHGLFFANVG